MDFSVLERLPTKNPDTLRDLLAEVSAVRTIDGMLGGVMGWRQHWQQEE